jgi:hypothetical protein
MRRQHDDQPLTNNNNNRIDFLQTVVATSNLQNQNIENPAVGGWPSISRFISSSSAFISSFLHPFPSRVFLARCSNVQVIFERSIIIAIAPVYRVLVEPCVAKKERERG